MIWTNYHCHSSYCDGKAKAEDFVLEAIKNNMPVLGFTGHGPVPFDSVWNMTEKDLPAYLEEIDILKSKYNGQIEILCALEVDYISGLLDAQSPVFTNQLDYRISSVHYLDQFEEGGWFTIDGPPAEWEAGLAKLYNNDVFKVVDSFVDKSIEMIEKGGFEIIGHIDKSFQHGHKYFSVDDPRYVEAINRLLKVASEHAIIVEINTKSFERLGFFYPHQHFFKTLKEFNIPVTINSDSHHPLLLTSGMANAAKALLDAGIKETYEFIGGSWKAFPLTPEGINIYANS